MLLYYALVLQKIQESAMKLNPFLVLSLFFASSAAMACPHNQQQFICPGDEAVNPYGQAGRITSVNPFDHKVTLTLKGLSIGSSFNVSEVLLAQGCLEGICVGDQVVNPYGQPGTIAGVNPYKRQVALQLPGLSISSIFSVDDIGSGIGCLRGYCVGDTVTNPYGQTGTLVAINYHNGKGAFQNKGLNISSYFDITQLGSMVYCTTYGDFERSVPRYPDFGNDDYVGPDFHFSMQRPHHRGGDRYQQPQQGRDDRRGDDDRRGGNRRHGPNRGGRR
jgi:hypothetical protein